MSERTLRVALGNAATDRIGRKGVLGAFVERNVQETSRFHSVNGPSSVEVVALNLGDSLDIEY